MLAAGAGAGSGMGAGAGLSSTCGIISTTGSAAGASIATGAAGNAPDVETDAIPGAEAGSKAGEATGLLSIAGDKEAAAGAIDDDEIEADGAGANAGDDDAEIAGAIAGEALDASAGSEILAPKGEMLLTGLGLANPPGALAALGDNAGIEGPF